MPTMMVQIRRKGLITLPVELRRQYGLSEGDVFTLVDLGDGSFFLTPRVSQLAHSGLLGQFSWSEPDQADGCRTA